MVFSACLEGSGLYQQGPRGSRMVVECISAPGKWMGRKVRPSHTFFWAMGPSVQSLSRVRLCNLMNCSMPGLPVHHQFPEFIQTHAHQVGDVIQPSPPLSSPSPPAPNSSKNQGLFQRVNSSHEVAKVLEFQLQYQSFQRTPRTDLL